MDYYNFSTQEQENTSKKMPWGDGGFGNRTTAQGTHSQTCFMGKSGFRSTVSYGKNCPGCKRQMSMRAPGYHNRPFTVLRIMKMFK